MLDVAVRCRTENLPVATARLPRASESEKAMKGRESPPSVRQDNQRRDGELRAVGRVSHALARKEAVSSSENEGAGGRIPCPALETVSRIP